MHTKRITNSFQCYNNCDVTEYWCVTKTIVAALFPRRKASLFKNIRLITAQTMEYSITPYVLVLTGLIPLTCGLFLLTAYDRNSELQKSQVNSYAYFFLLQAVGYIFIVTRGITDLHLGIFLTNFSTFVSFFLLINGLRIRASRQRITFKVILACSLFFTLIQVFVFSYFYPSITARITLSFLLWITTVTYAINILKLSAQSRGRQTCIVSMYTCLICIGVDFVLLYLDFPQAFTAFLFSYSISYVLLFGGLTNLILSDQTEKHRYEAITDPLTELYNRRYFMSQGKSILSSAQRHNHGMAFIICDIDKFKSINDSFGHGTGDVVIRAFAEILKQALREEDLLARIGGEEFAIMLPHTDIETAKEVAERIRATTAEKHLTIDNKHVYFTASFGISAPIELDIEKSMKAADSALYIAKKNGRNRTEVIHQDTEIEF